MNKARRFLGGAMLRISLIGPISVIAALSGCSIHPLPKDVTRDTTFEIINKIRCEARDAVVGRILFVLSQPPPGQTEPSVRNLALLRKFEMHGISEDVMYNTSIDEADMETAKLLRRFDFSSITYNFLFTIFENKVKSGGATFTMPFTKGTFTLGLKAGSDKTRKTTRTIKLQDTFSSLVTGRTSKGVPTGLECEYVHRPRKHWIYPITGEIGLAEVVNTFIDVEKASGTVETFSDKLTFTTTFNAGADPSVALDTPFLRQMKLTKANVSYSAKREDQHEVSLVFAKPKRVIVARELEELFTPFIVEGSRLRGLPQGAEFGLAVRVPKTTKKIPDDSTRGRQTIRTPSPVAPRPSRRLFEIPADAEASSLRRGLLESNRLERVDRQRDIDLLIGR